MFINGWMLSSSFKLTFLALLSTFLVDVNVESRLYDCYFRATIPCQ